MSMHVICPVHTTMGASTGPGLGHTSQLSVTAPFHIISCCVMLQNKTKTEAEVATEKFGLEAGLFKVGCLQRSSAPGTFASPVQTIRVAAKPQRTCFTCVHVRLYPPPWAHPN